MTPITQEEKEILENRKDLLQQQLTNLRIRQKNRQNYNRIYLTLGAILILLAFVLLFNLNIGSFKNFLMLVVCFVYGSTLILLPVLRPTHQLEILVKDVENEIDLISVSDSSMEQRAEKLFKLHQFELKKYYDQTLKHSSWIFGIGILCIIIGFSIIGITIYLVIPGTLISQKIIIATLGGIGGVLSNFIAVIYLKIYSETIKSLQEFHNRLVITHHLHFSNFLIAKIKDEKLREQTIADLALNLNKIQACS